LADVLIDSATACGQSMNADPPDGMGVYTSIVSVGLAPAWATTGGYLPAHHDQIENPTRDKPPKAADRGWDFPPYRKNRW
jgi:hypothetical protein